MTAETEDYNEYDEDDDNDNDNDNNIDRPRLQNTTSQQRPQTEKTITKKEFKKYRGLIKKRLSAKQRMSFEELISRNIHAGLQDELHEKRPMEKSKKILQLNRRLSHRPHPSDIQNDDELPNDLKKADSEYQKLYKYREYDSDESSDSSDGPPPPRNRTTSDPNPSPIDKIIKPLSVTKKVTSIDNPLDWKISQRSSTKELEIRGIIPEQYADVVHGNKSLEDAKKEWEAYKKKSSIKIKNKINLKFRPTKKDLRDRGIIYEEIEMKELKKTKQKNIKSLSMKLKQRIDPNEADQRAIINKDELFSNVDYDLHKKEKQKQKKVLKLKMQSSINQRANKNEIISRGIIHKEYLNNDYNIAKNNIKQNRNSIKQTIKNAIPKLYPNIINNNEDEEDEDEEDNIPTFLDRLKQEKDETSKTLQNHLRKRSTVEELQKQGILPLQVPFGTGYDAEMENNNTDTNTNTNTDTDTDTDDDEFVSFLDRMKQERTSARKSIAEKHARRPTADDLIKRGILKEGTYDTVYMSNEYANSLEKEEEEEEEELTPPEIDSSSSSSSSSASDSSQDRYPTFLDRMRQETEIKKKKLENAHRRRPSQQDLEDKGIVERGYFDNMQVALTKKKQRRQSFTTELASFFQQRPDIAEMLTKGLVAAEFIGMDSMEMSNRRKAIKNTLNKKLNKKRRPTMDDLEMRGIVPAGYFNDAQKAVIKKHTRRMTAEKELGNFLPQRMNPRRMMEKGFMPKNQFENIMGINMNYNNGSLGVAGVISQKMVKQTINESKKTDKNNKNNKNNKRISSGIGDIVLDLPQYAEHNLFNHDNWTQNLYESLLNSLQFSEILQKILGNKELEKNMLSKYEKFERLYHTKMNTLQREKSIIYDKIIECEKEENESLLILKNLIIEHSSLEQKIRPQMKMLLHKMTLVENRINREENIVIKKEYEKELNYYDTYITELKNVFIHTNNIRSKYQNTIHTLIKYKKNLNIQLKTKENEINTLKIELNNKLGEFNKLFEEEEDNNNNNNNNNNVIINEQKYDPLSSDPITDLNGVLDEKNKNIDHNLDLLSFRISTIPATDYALRVIELCQLSYIYKNEKLKSFFEWFIRFAVQTFIEITYAHTCFTTQNINAINNEINKLKSIKFIAQLINLPQPNDNKLNFDKMLYDYLTIIVSYLELLPSNNNNNIMSNNNIDHEYVIFHVARYLTSNFIFAQDIILQNEEQDIPHIAQQQVYQWINIILQSTKSKIKYSNDYNKIVNKTNNVRDIIKATQYDSIARIRPARAAAIVMDYVYNIHVHG